MFTLDANTIGDYFRGEPLVVPKLQSLPPSQIGVPAIVTCDLRYELMRLPAAASKRYLLALEQFLAPVRLLSFDEAAGTQAASIMSSMERGGRNIGWHSTLVAATAMSHGSTLVSRNMREFGQINGLSVVNWHDDQLQGTSTLNSSGD